MTSELGDVRSARIYCVPPITDSPIHRPRWEEGHITNQLIMGRGPYFWLPNWDCLVLKKKNSIAPQVSVKGSKLLEPAASQKVILNLRASCEEQLGTGRISVMLKKALADHTEAGNLISAGRVSSTPLNPVTLTEYFSQTFKSFLPSRDGLFKLNLGGARSTPLVFSSQAFSMALLLGIFEFSGSRRPPAHTSNTMVGAECLLWSL